MSIQQSSIFENASKDCQRFCVDFLLLTIIRRHSFKLFYLLLYEDKATVLVSVITCWQNFAVLFTHLII